MKWVRSDIPKGEVENSQPAESSQPSAEVRYLRKRVRPARLSEYELVSLKRRKYNKSQKKIAKTNQETESNKENTAKESELILKKESEPCVIRCHQNRVLVNHRRRTFPPVQTKHETAEKWVDVNWLYNNNLGRNLETGSNSPVGLTKHCATNEIPKRKKSKHVFVHPMELFQKKLKNSRKINGGATNVTLEQPQFIPTKPKKERNRIEEILAMQSDRLNDSQYEIYEGVINYIVNSI